MEPSVLEKTVRFVRATTVYDSENKRICLPQGTVIEAVKEIRECSQNYFDIVTEKCTFVGVCQINFIQLPIKAP